MACGVANKEAGNVQQFLAAVACGQKYENPHFKHYCVKCVNMNSDECVTECWHGPICHFEGREPADVSASTGSYGDEALEG